MMAKLHKIMDSMVGVHLNAHVMGKHFNLKLISELSDTETLSGGYEFLMQNCKRSKYMN